MGNWLMPTKIPRGLSSFLMPPRSWGGGQGLALGGADALGAGGGAIGVGAFQTWAGAAGQRRRVAASSKGD